MSQQQTFSLSPSMLSLNLWPERRLTLCGKEGFSVLSQHDVRRILPWLNRIGSSCIFSRLPTTLLCFKNRVEGPSEICLDCWVKAGAISLYYRHKVRFQLADPQSNLTKDRYSTLPHLVQRAISIPSSLYISGRLCSRSSSDFLMAVQYYR